MVAVEHMPLVVVAHRIHTILRVCRCESPVALVHALLSSAEFETSNFKQSFHLREFQRVLVQFETIFHKTNSSRFLGLVTVL